MTVVEQSSQHSVTNKGDDVEAAGGGRRPKGDVPIGLWHSFWFLLFFLLFGIVIVLESLLQHYAEGWPAPEWWITERFEWRYYVVSSAPLAGALVLSLLWGTTQSAMLKLQPLLNMTASHRSGNAERTVLLDYTGNELVSSWRAIRNSDYAVLLLIASSLLTTAIKPLAGALLSARDVWWLDAPQTVAGVTKVSQDVGDEFKDMIAFQGASGYATARVLFDIGPAPFITADGHTVEAFELPVGKNGTAYANVTAVFNRAVCVPPTTMDNDVGTRIWHNTAWFDDCRFSWTVNNDSSNLFGVETLPDAAGCSNFTGTPLQHRPVVFWFFSYEPQPIFSVVQCTPQVTVSNVNVAVDLVSNTTTLVTINETTTSTIGSLGYLPYNGLFFDDGTLDQTAMSRLQSVQEQLLSAAFQAAKARDPALRNTFVYYGFTNITADIYNTYLSLIAKSLYFVPSDEPVLIQVGANCKRLFFVPIVTHSLCAVMVVLGVYGAVMCAVHIYLRRRFTIPEYYGTIATGYLLPVDRKASIALEHAAHSKEGILQSLANYRFGMNVQTGVLGVTHVRSSPPSAGKLERLWRGWFVRPWRAVFGSGAGEMARDAETASMTSTATSASSCRICRSRSTVTSAATSTTTLTAV
ncbi:hypothetical protein L226DRAFT_567116 [Lentinus tigrinus ALCF2SS1-7]|uniref:Uncharacterized protein n=1 Tax=Lentinus tigrinus ALCF2SS1-6 TaxID=1328759 RepID=A0A5C2SRH4_9APHY|nr:hypothetical protein L227DRAFT_607151 [Lentinus tigrinus ALCF2SS1-6]RPD78915.1 hypothetical protein L226DRAFT_567116 [Lentinus tigrinus ALCF2SS1-7]